MLFPRITLPTTPTHNTFFDPFCKHPISPHCLRGATVDISSEPGCYEITAILPNVKHNSIQIKAEAKKDLRILADTLLEGGAHFEVLIEFAHDADMCGCRCEFASEVLMIRIWRW
jgi:hypothetical protein